MSPCSWQGLPWHLLLLLLLWINQVFQGHAGQLRADGPGTALLGIPFPSSPSTFGKECAALSACWAAQGCVSCLSLARGSLGSFQLGLFPGFPSGRCSLNPR